MAGQQSTTAFSYHLIGCIFLVLPAPKLAAVLPLLKGKSVPQPFLVAHQGPLARNYSMTVSSVDKLVFKAIH